MKTKSRGIPLNYSIVVPVWRSMKHAILMLHEKYNSKNKWPNIQVRNKSIKQPQLFFTNRRLLFCLIVRKEECHFV